ncbi:uncharacterized protein PFLUO_LOCUS6670 [Penicillium psychrofluorescens]|uniref:uncharacterized protein n=1 Tax=Penicillium psychrofluorescens TaxID=3158075 RepID=UPI003CCCEE74
MTHGPYPSAAKLKDDFYERGNRHLLSFANPDSFTFAIIDKTRPSSPEDPEGELAGTVSYCDASAVHLVTEIGFIIILPPYQRSHVATNALGLLLNYALNEPDQGGLGLRRVHWMASAANTASARLAERMGFERVGFTPWQMRFVKGKEKGKIGNGKEPPSGSDPADLWRDTVDLSLAWDQWQRGAKEKTQKAMVR